MTFLIQQTLIYGVPLLIVALAGVFAERSGIINLALEGIMIFGAFVGVLFIKTMQESKIFTPASGQWLLLLTMLVSAILGAVFSLLLSFSAVTLKADQTIGGTALNLLAPALVLFLINVIAKQNVLRTPGESTAWFMIKKSTFGIEKGTDIGFFGELFLFGKLVDLRRVKGDNPLRVVFGASDQDAVFLLIHHESRSFVSFGGEERFVLHDFKVSHRSSHLLYAECESDV